MNTQDVLSKLEKISQEIKQIAESMSNVTAPVTAPVAVDNPLDKKSGVCSNAWPSEKWKTPFVRVIEVTGKKNGYYQDAMWFHLDHAAGAQKYLTSLDQGNAWLSEVWIENGLVVSGRRKRVKLNHPHAVERKACVYEL
jgi:hypothetical protein